MDSDHYKVPVRAAAEGGRVLPAVSQPGLRLSSTTSSGRRGDGDEAVGVQRETGYVHVSGESSCSRSTAWSGFLQLMYKTVIVFRFHGTLCYLTRVNTFLAISGVCVVFEGKG